MCICCMCCCAHGMCTQKPHGYHLDLFVLSILILLCSLLGLPWFVAATVQAISHVRSLVRESEVKIPGEKPHIIGIRWNDACFPRGEIGLISVLTPCIGLS